jgi:hypothetical protein
MFISNAEKHDIQVAINLLKGQIAFLLDEVKDLKASKHFKDKGPTKAFIIRTAEAPWGYKLDGTPKKQPGRITETKPETKNEQPVSV